MSVDLSSTAAIEAAGVDEFRELLGRIGPEVVFANEEEAELVGEIETETLVIKRGAGGIVVVGRRVRGEAGRGRRHDGRRRRARGRLPPRRPGARARRGGALRGNHGGLPAVTDLLRIHPEVRAALESRRPVVALETTLVAHGFPGGVGAEVAAEAERRVRVAWAVPATIGVVDGAICVGLEAGELERFATSPDARKVGPRDLAACAVARERSARRPWAATLAVCRAAGIGFMGTGGIGGVHRGWTHALDVSADLGELGPDRGARRRVGREVASSTCDATAEVLETLGVPGPRLAHRRRCRSSTQATAARRSPRACRRSRRRPRSRSSTGASGATPASLLARPPDESLDVEPLIEEGIAEAERQGVRGQAVTPFVLAYLHEQSGGRTIEVNKKLIVENAALAAEVATAYSKLT